MSWVKILCLPAIFYQDIQAPKQRFHRFAHCTESAESNSQSSVLWKSRGELIFWSNLGDYHPQRTSNDHVHEDWKGSVTPPTVSSLCRKKDILRGKLSSICGLLRQTKQPAGCLQVRVTTIQSVIVLTSVIVSFLTVSGGMSSTLYMYDSNKKDNTGD